jgi:NAD(P)H dehydrogenase (quinone)
MSGLVAVTGASGHLGRLVARELSTRGVRQRVVTRSPARTPLLDDAEVAIADYADVAAMSDALDGVGTLFFVSGHEAHDRLDLHRGVVQAAARAGVRRVVYTSFMGAAPQASFSYARDHAHTERAIIDAGMALTALRDSLYADWAPLFVGADGVVRGPAGNGTVAWVARADVARLAVAVLLDDTHAGAIYDVSGPSATDMDETVRLLSAVTGREISYHAETVDEARASRAGAGVEDWQIEGWIGSYLAIATGEVGVTSHTIEALTGRRPMAFDEFLRATPEAWAHLTAPPPTS